MKTLENIFSEEFISAIGWTLLHSLWQGALIALLLGVVLLFLQKKSSAFRYNIGASAIVLTLIGFLSTFTYLYQNELGATLNDEKLVVVVDATNATNPALDVIENQTLLSVFTDYFNHHLPIIVVLWLLGVMVLSLRFLGGIAYLERLKHSQNRPLEALWQQKMNSIKASVGVQQSIQLLESALIKVPMVVGYLKPIILLPVGTVNALSTAEVEAILAHELAHIRRNDYLINLVQSVIDVLFFYHPAVWWMSNTVRAERENCCDDLALSVTGNSLIIAKALANLEAIRMSNHQLSVAFTGNKNQLLNRISRLLGQPMKKNNQFLESIIAIFIIIICLTTVNYNVNAHTVPSTIVNVEAIIDTIKPLTSILETEKDIKEEEEEIIEEYIIIEETEEAMPQSFEWVSASDDFPKKVKQPSSRFFLNNNKLETIDLKELKSVNQTCYKLPKTVNSNNIFGYEIVESFPNEGRFRFEFKDQKLATSFKTIDLNPSLFDNNISSSFFTENQNGILDLQEHISFDNIHKVKVIQNLNGQVDTSILDKYEDADIIFIDGDKTVIIRNNKHKESRTVIRGLAKKARKEAELARIKAQKFALKLEKQTKIQQKEVEKLAELHHKKAKELAKVHEKRAKAYQKEAEKRTKLAQIRAEKIVIRGHKRNEKNDIKIKEQQERIEVQLQTERERIERDLKKREQDTKQIEAELIKDGLLKKGKRLKTLDVNNRNDVIVIKFNGKKIPANKLDKYIQLLEKQQAQKDEE